MPADKIHVYKSSDSDYRIEPPLAELKAGVTFKIRNHTTDELVFYVEGGALGVNPKVEVLKSKDVAGPFTPAAQGTTGTVYTYCIFDPRSGKKGKGNSDPVMVVDN